MNCGKINFIVQDICQQYANVNYMETNENSTNKKDVRVFDLLLLDFKII